MVHIMYGLPASGKTTYAMELYETYKKKYDKVKYKNIDPQDEEDIQNFPRYGRSRENDIIIDGWFQNTDKMISDIKEKAFGFCYYHDFTIHIFEQDIQKCLANDAKRGRENKATHTIITGQEPFDKKLFEEKMKTRGYEQFFKLKIVKVPVNDYSEKDDRILYSDWRCNSEITEGFVELDKYLEKYYPEISFLKYKALQKKVKMEEDYSSDYYDEQSTTSVQWSIKISDILGEVK